VDGLRIEFLPDPEPQPAADWPPPRVPRALLLAAAALLTAALIVTVRSGGEPPRSGRPLVAPSPTVSSPVGCIGSACTSDPSPDIRAVFAEDLPGSVVMDENTVVAHRGVHNLRSRTLRVVYGNVVMTVTISAEPRTVPPPHATYIDHDGYLIDFTFVGYYPPTPGQIRALATDPRLVSLQA